MLEKRKERPKKFKKGLDRADIVRDLRFRPFPGASGGDPIRQRWCLESVVTRIGLRWLVNALIAAAIFAILYKHWLTTPVLRYVSVGQWRWLALMVAAACGGVLWLWRFSALALSSGAVTGLLLGGTWAEWTAPNDVKISVYHAFASHLESFWLEILRLTVTTTVTAFHTISSRNHPLTVLLIRASAQLTWSASCHTMRATNA